jgi:CPA2 family monovalent cation:H+ antiporter-2
MDHEPAFISTIAIGLTAAFVGGLVARRLGLPSIVGYLLAGIAIGPFTPGLVADPNIATELAEIGVILLMFGVGIHFSIRDLLAVKGIAIPGAVVQSTVATVLGVGLGIALGWGLGGGLVLGLALSVASTVVLLLALNERGEIESPQGRIAIGWLVVEDLFTVVVLVLLPAVAPVVGGADTGSTTPFGPAGDLVLALAKAAVFAGLMLVVGVRVLPPLLAAVAREGSRELFTLGVLAIALGIAYIAFALFGVSFALGAFLAGAIVGESDLSHHAAAEALPLQDAFAVLFFVSVGMLFDPAVLIQQPLAILAVLGLIVVAKSLAAFLIVQLFGYPVRTGLTVAAGLAQVGEFSFILATLGLSLELLPADGFQLVVAGALISITLNPFLFRAVDPLEHRFRDSRLVRAAAERRAGELARLGPAVDEALHGHAILCGYGRVGRMIAGALERRAFPYAVISLDRRAVEHLRERGVPALSGDATNGELLEHAHVGTARELIVAFSDMAAARRVAEEALAANPRLQIVVRTSSDREAAHLRSLGTNVTPVHAERELAVQMTRWSLRRFGVSGQEAEAIAVGLRGRAVLPIPAPSRDGVLARLRRRLAAFRGRGSAATIATGAAPAPAPERQNAAPSLVDDHAAAGPAEPADS